MCLDLDYPFSPATAANTVIYTVTTRDEDVITPFNKVTLSIEQGFDRSADMFSINQRGEVRVRPGLGADGSDVSTKLS